MRIQDGIRSLAARLRRAAVVATLVRGNERVRCYTVHLSPVLSISGSSRREQVRVLIADTRDSPDPVVIAGDFNSYGIGREFSEAGFAWLTRDTGPTFSRFLLGFRYDHVFARGAWGAPAGGTAGIVEDNRKASDHKALWAVVEFEG